MYGRKGNMGTCNSNSRSSASGAGSGAEQTTEYNYQQIIGNGRTTRSELDNAQTVEQVKQIQNRMQEIINNDNALSKQGKIAYTEAMQNRIEDALIRTTPISNKKEMISFFKEFADVDLKPHLEEGKHFGKNFGKSRTQITVKANELTDAQRKRIGNFVKKKNIRSGYVPGFDWITYDFQK